MAKKDKFGTEKRSESAKWTSKVMGPQDFSEDHKLRMPGTFEKGQTPEPNSATEDADSKVS